MKVPHSICQKIRKTQKWPQDWKRSVFIPISKNGNAKKCSEYHTIALIPHTRKLMPKILQVMLQQYMNWELADVQAGFRKHRGTRNQNHQHPLDHQKCKRVPEKHLLLLYWLCQSLWLYSVQFSSVTQSRPTLCDPMDYAYQAPPSMGFSRQDYWSVLLLPSPLHIWGYWHFLILAWASSSPVFLMMYSA